VLFAWSAMGSAFGPILLARLAGRRLSAATTMTAMLTGFLLTVVISAVWSTPGNVAERVLPFFVALAIAFGGSKR
jgi:Na+/proline symporter